jgi:hypothetical protein
LVSVNTQIKARAAPDTSAIEENPAPARTTARSVVRPLPRRRNTPQELACGVLSSVDFQAALVR